MNTNFQLSFQALSRIKKLEFQKRAEDLIEYYENALKEYESPQENYIKHKNPPMIEQTIIGV